MTITGRAVFLGKVKAKSHRRQGILTDQGHKAFEASRRALARLVGWAPAEVSDSDTIEYLARGTAATRVYLRRRKQLREESGNHA